MTALFKDFFVISLPAFKEGGLLWGATKAFGSSLIMYHNMLPTENGASDAVATKLCNSLRQIELADNHWPGMAPETVLSKLSEIGLKWFRDINVELAPAKPDMVSMANLISQQNRAILDIGSEMISLTTLFEADWAYRNQMVQENSFLHDRVCTLEHVGASLLLIWGLFSHARGHSRLVCPHGGGPVLYVSQILRRCVPGTSAG